LPVKENSQTNPTDLIKDDKKGYQDHIGIRERAKHGFFFEKRHNPAYCRSSSKGRKKVASPVKAHACGGGLSLTSKGGQGVRSTGRGRGIAHTAIAEHGHSKVGCWSFRMGYIG